jgi:hypothetical protein
VNTESVQVEIVKPEKKMSIMSMLNSEGLDSLVDVALKDKVVPNVVPFVEPVQTPVEVRDEATYQSLELIDYETPCESESIATAETVEIISKANSFGLISSSLINPTPNDSNIDVDIHQKVTLIQLAPSSIAADADLQHDPTLELAKSVHLVLNNLNTDTHEEQMEDGEMVESSPSIIADQSENVREDVMSILQSFSVHDTIETDQSMVVSTLEEGELDTNGDVDMMEIEESGNPMSVDGD